MLGTSARAELRSMIECQQAVLAHGFPPVPEVAAAAAVDRQHDLFDPARTGKFLLKSGHHTVFASSC